MGSFRPARRRAWPVLACLVVLSMAGLDGAWAAAPAHASPVHASQDAGRTATYSPALLAIHVRPAWKRTTGQGVTVAVIDSGVDGRVVNLRGHVLAGIDMVEPHRTNGWHDQVAAGGHGTGVASIIAGNGKGIPVHGIAPGVQILPVRILDAHGLCPDARVARGIRWATRRGADVINLSVGTSAAEISGRDLRREHSAVRFAVKHGVIVVAGAGNDGPDNDGAFYPAAFPEVIAVGGANATGSAPAPFSDRGPWVDTSAPAVEVWNANVDGTLGRASGTSFSAPAVAATVALMLAVNPRLSPSAIRRIILGTAVDLGLSGHDRETGAGLVAAAAAVSAAARAAH